MEADQALRGPEQGDSASLNDAFLNRGPRSPQRIFDLGSLTAQLRFRRGANLEHRDASLQGRKAIFQLHAVILRKRAGEMCPHKIDALLDALLVAGATHNGGANFVHDHAGGASQVLQPNFARFDDDFAARDGRQIFEHRGAAMARGRRFHHAAFQDAANLIDHQGSERNAGHIFGHDQQRLARLGDLRKNASAGCGRQLFDLRDRILIQEDVRVFQHRLIALHIGHEVVR